MTTELLTHADQARSALVVANNTRLGMVGVRREVRELARSPYDILREVPEEYQRERLNRFLLAVPGVGPDRVDKITRGLVQNANIRLERLSPKTRRALAERLSDFQPTRWPKAAAFRSAYELEGWEL